MNQKIIKEFVEKGANLEHDRWARWQSWCHKILRGSCPSPKLERVLKHWDRQIATPYSELSEQEKESDRKETRDYIPLLEKALKDQREEIWKWSINNYDRFMEEVWCSYRGKKSFGELFEEEYEKSTKPS